MESDTDDAAAAVSSHAGSGGARNWEDEVKDTTELENELKELWRSVESEPWFTSKQTSPNISLEDMERELHDLMSAGEQQQQQQHAKSMAVTETLTTNLGGGVQFLTELNPGNFPNPFQQQPNPPLGVEVEVEETAIEDACSNRSLPQSRRVDEAEADDLMSAGVQQQQQQHAKSMAVTETLTTNLGGGVQFLTELNPGNFPNPFQQQPNPPLGVEVEVEKTAIEDACSNSSSPHSCRVEAEADADAPAAPFRRLLGRLMTLEQADRILSEAEGKYGAFENIMPFTDGEVQRLESVRSALLQLGFDCQSVQALLVPQLWKPKFLMLEVMRLLRPEAVVEAADIWDKWSLWVRKPESEDESHEGDYDSDDFHWDDLGDQPGGFDYG